MSEGASTTGLSGVKVDTEVLRESGVVLREVSTGFLVDDNLLEIALEGIGSPSSTGRPRSAGIWQLDKALNAFSGQWRVRRETVKEQVDSLSGTVTMIADNFDGVDVSLKNAIAPPKAQYNGGVFGPVPDSVWE